ncbi:MAG: iron-containing alcohol dehydrogenase [Eubacterium sp.]|nr:iron-containing alcohol dehydrogenase [Eubacterium sp.]
MFTQVVNEEYAVLHSANLISRLGRRALIITGRHSAKRNGSLMELQKVLQDTGTEYVIYDRIEENPSVETVMEARDVGISKGADFVIGIGGGSPMDAAKAVAILLYNSDKGEMFLYEKPSHDKCDKNGNTLAYPVVEIPTTCGTGSEVTGVSVLTRHDLKTKKSLPHKVYPVLALMDPRYLMYAPYEVLRDTAIDAMSHLVESYINNNATAVTRAKVLEGLKIWGRSKQVILGERRVGYTKDEHVGNVSDFVRRKADPDRAAADKATDLKILSDMLRASNIAGEAIAVTGTSLPHALSYRLTYQAGIKHGPATGIFQPGFMKYADEDTRKKLLTAMDFDTLEDFKYFLGQVCDIGKISENDYGIIVETSIKEILRDQARLDKVPYRVTREVLEDIVSG